MPKPTFVCIGCQRCGTTYLHYLLKNHPNIVMPNTGQGLFGKELHYFNDLIGKHGLRWYEDQFEPAEAEAAIAFGEITPAYSILPKFYLRRIREYLGADLKILLVVREPSARVLSHFKMEKAHLDSNTRRVRTVTLTDIVKFCQSDGVVRRTRYARICENWRSVFGPDNVKVITYEDLVVRTGETFRDVCNFIGVTATQLRENNEKINSSGNLFIIQNEVYSYLTWKWQRERAFHDRVLADGRKPETGRTQPLLMQIKFLFIELVYKPTRIRTWLRFQLRFFRKAKELDRILAGADQRNKAPISDGR